MSYFRRSRSKNQRTVYSPNSTCYNMAKVAPEGELPTNTLAQVSPESVPIFGLKNERSMVSAINEVLNALPPRKKSFFKKYFMDGQALEQNAKMEVPEDADFFQRILITKRKYIAVVLPTALMLTAWLFTAIRFDWFSEYATHWKMPLVMVLGCAVAGLTAESGGAVAFPVMTLAMHILPEDARDFSILIETFGMVCGMFSIVFMRVQIEDRTILFGIMGSIPGLIFGFEVLDGLLTGPQKKMLFVSIWSSFAIALFLLNREKKRKTFMTIPDFKPWKALVLVATGFVGGILTAFTGSGADICLFSMITVLFRVSEKSATPTTIMIMGVNAVIGSYYRAIWVGTVADETWKNVQCTIPVSLIGVPLAHFIGSHFHRQVLAAFVYVLEFVAVIGFVITGPPFILLIIGACIIVVGFVFFYTMGRIGAKMLIQIEINL